MDDELHRIPGKSALTEAAKRIAPYINRTPLLTSSSLDKLFDTSLYFKCENFQKVGAFKARGATNAVFSLEPALIRNGVATHSSGNHAQALSRAALHRDIPAYIVMPSNSSKVKVEAVKEYQGRITFCEPTLEAREKSLLKIIEKTGATEIHPYNNPMIIAGQSTAAMEAFEDVRDAELILTPVGGGGLTSGTALAAFYFSPSTKVIACEPEQANDAYLSFTQKKFIPSVHPQTIADGLRTSLGSLTFPIILEHVSEIITVKEVTIIAAMRLIWERMKILIEPSSAVPVAALMEKKIDVKGRKTIVIISGGNVDLDALPWIT